MTVWLDVGLLLAALAIVAFLAAAPLGAWWRRRRSRRRLEHLAEETREERPEEGAPTEPGPVEKRLRAAGIALPGLVLAAVLATLALAAGFAILAATGLLAAAVLAAAVAVWIAWFVLGSVARARARRFEERLADAVGLMIALLEVGENPRDALEGGAEGAEEPVARELRRAVDRLDSGAGIREALDPIRLGYDSEGVRLFTQALIAHWDVGGDLAPLLRRVHRLMLERMAMRLRLRAELAGARLAAMIVAVLPYVLIPVFAWRRPEWLRAVVEHPLGLQLLLGAVLLQIVGLLWLASLFRLEATT